MIKQFVVFFMIFVLCFPRYSYAFLAPTTVQRVMSGVIQSKMLKRGLAANDPRFAATLTAAGSEIVGASAAAAVVTLAGVTAPAWVTVGATVALGSVFAAGISIAADKTIKWFFNSDGSVKTGSTAVPSGIQTTIDITTSSVTLATIVSNSIGHSWTTIRSTPPNYFTDTWYSQTTQTNPDTSKYRYSQSYNYNGTVYYVYKIDTIQSTTACPANYTLNGTQCVANAQPVSVSPSDAVSTLTQDQLSKAADPEVVSKMAQAAWEKAAAKSGYQGFPVDASDPITPADVQAYKDANPATWPTVKDVVSPQPLPAGTSDSDGPFSLPVPTSTPTTPSDGSGGTSGSVFDWSILPSNETPSKTEAQVSYSPVSFAQSATCPSAISYEVFGETYNISYGPLCDLLTNVVSPISIVIATVAAAFIFARGLKA